MKITCTCGNEVNLIEPNDNEERAISDEGLYVVPDNYGKMDIWEKHDVVGIYCRKCEKSIWMFV